MPRSRSSARGGGRGGPPWGRVLLAILGLGAAFYLASQWWGTRPPPPPIGASAERQENKSAAPRRSSRPARRPLPAGAPDAGADAAVPQGPARIALVIDDLGRSLADLEALARLEVPLSYAVLPFETMTAEVTAALAAKQAEILCHLPMAAEDGQDPGAGALLAGMDPDELERRTRAALAAVPGAAGANNHMGSALTADESAMRRILGVLSERGLFFVDSRTSPATVGFDTALALDIPAAARDVFLDADPESTAVAAEFQRLLGIARERGAAIAIGHPHPATLAMLAREVPLAVAAGYEFVPVSYLLESPGELPE